MTDAMNQPNFRTAGTQMRLAEAIYRGMFEGAPHPYLILAPTLRIAGVNEAYMAATLRRRDALVGFDMFDAFPDNPLDDQATGVRNLGASFERALAHVRVGGSLLEPGQLAYRRRGRFGDRHRPSRD